MKKKMVPVLLLIVAVVIVVELKNHKNSDCEVCAPPIPAVLSEHERTQEKPAGQRLPRLLDLGAGKCVPCKAMAPILDEMKATFAGQLDVRFIDVWENESASGKYGIRIIPTQIFHDTNGQELFRHEGFISREDILAKWKELGYEFK